MGLKTNGTLWAAWDNDYGQLKDGTTTNRLTFVQIGTDNDWALITADDKQSVAIKKNGTLWGWGKNLNGVFGLPLSVSYVNAPLHLGTVNDWSKVATVGGLIYAIKTNGTLWSNNENGFYQVGADNDWNFVDSGGNHMFRMKTNGSLWGVGANNYGQLGLGHGIERTLVPTKLDCSTLGIKDITNQNVFSVYPNPTDNLLFIKNTTARRIDEIKITDLTGKAIYITKNVTEIDLNNYPAGMYIVSILSSNTISRYKVIKK